MGFLLFFLKNALLLITVLTNLFQVSTMDGSFVPRFYTKPAPFVIEAEECWRGLISIHSADCRRLFIIDMLEQMPIH